MARKEEFNIGSGKETPRHDHPWHVVEYYNKSRANTTNVGDENRYLYKTREAAKKRARTWVEDQKENRPNQPKVAHSGWNIKITKHVTGDYYIEAQRKYCELCAPEMNYRITTAETPTDTLEQRTFKATMEREDRNRYERGERLPRKPDRYIVPANPTETPPPHVMDI